MAHWAAPQPRAKMLKVLNLGSRGRMRTFGPKGLKEVN